MVFVQCDAGVDKCKQLSVEWKPYTVTFPIHPAPFFRSLFFQVPTPVEAGDTRPDVLFSHFLNIVECIDIGEF